MNNTKMGLAVALVAAAALATTACASPAPAPTDSGDEGPAPAELQHVHMAEVAGANALFFQYGAEQGFFEEEGIDLEVDASAGGAAALPALVAGDLDISGSNVVSTLTAISKDLPLVIITGGSVSAPAPDDWVSIIVRPDSGLEEFADLQGKRVAINTLRNVNDVLIQEVVDRAGGDPSTITFVEFPFPEMAAAVVRGDVDAALLGDPFRTLAVMNNDLVYLAGGSGYSALEPYIQIGTYVTTRDYAAANPDVVKGFQVATKKTAEAIAADPAAFRQALIDVVGMDPAVAEAINLPAWTGELDRNSVELFGSLMVKYGVVDAEPDYGAIFID